MKAPFYKYIIFQLFTNKNFSTIVESLRNKNFYVSSKEIETVYNEIIPVLPKVMSEKLINKDYLDLGSDTTRDMLKYYDIYEMYLDHLMKNKVIEVDGDQFYTKWFSDLEWVMSYKDVMSIINTLMFNEEPIESISTIIQFKYKKKVGVDALEFYQKIYWNTSNISAKEAGFKIKRRTPKFINSTKY